MHEKVKPFRCESCDKNFGTAANLQFHNQRNHQGDQVPLPVSEEKNEISFPNTKSSSLEEETEVPDYTNESLEQTQPATPTEKIGNILISGFFFVNSYFCNFIPKYFDFMFFSNFHLQNLVQQTKRLMILILPMKL